MRRINGKEGRRAKMERENAWTDVAFSMQSGAKWQLLPLNKAALHFSSFPTLFLFSFLSLNQNYSFFFFFFFSFFLFLFFFFVFFFLLGATLCLYIQYKYKYKYKPWVQNSVEGIRACKDGGFF